METMPYLATKCGATLVILEMEQIRTCALDVRTQWTLGRSCPGNSPDISLKSEIVSRQHGEFLHINGQWYYADKKGLNGTFHNGKKIESGLNGKIRAIPLNNGDILRIDYNDLNTPDKRGVWIMFTTESVSGTWNVYPLKQKASTIIGRNPEVCDIVQTPIYISGQHAKITYLNGNYYLSDCNSKAGTWLNKRKIQQAVILKEKDKFSLCDCHFIFTGNSLIYNKQENPIKQANQNYASKKVILRADIKSKKVKDKNGLKEKELLKNVKLEIKEGSLVALLGTSGAGKTTLMNCLNGSEMSGVTGKVSLYGEDITENFERLNFLIGAIKNKKDLVGNITQQNVFHEMLSVEEELMERATMYLPSDVSKKERKERVDNIISLLGLEKVRKSRIQKLSGGEQKRVHIGIELVADRKFLCIDEPDAGQDPRTKREVFSILQREAHNKGKSIIVIIHDVSEIHLFDQVIMLTKVNNVGRLAFSGTPEEAKRYFNMSIKEAYEELENNAEKYVRG